MKKLFFIVLLFGGVLCNAQNPYTGIWQGTMSSEGIEFFTVFSIEETEDGDLTGLMHMPQQMIINFESLTFETREDSIWIKIPAFRAQYSALVNKDTMYGLWYQMGEEITLNLGLTPETEAFQIRRPQTPTEPFPYYSKDVKFYNKKAKIWLAGTLTLPDTLQDWPVVVLVTGSGPQDRNESLLEHKPFLVIADYFTRNGIGVLRYDDRGVADSEGDFSSATTYDFASDAEAAIDFLTKKKFVSKDQIGLAGHSEGGMIAIMEGSNKKLAFSISMAGVGIPCDELLVLQNDLILKGYGKSEEMRKDMAEMNAALYELVQEEKDATELRKKIEVLIEETKAGLTEEQIIEYGLTDMYAYTIMSQVNTTWFRAFIAFDPGEYLKKIKVNFLAINGSSDVQVPAEVNINAMKSLIQPKKGQIVDFKIFDNLNHLFQYSESGMTTEYAMIEETIDPEVLEYMVGWIKKVLEN